MNFLRSHGLYYTSINSPEDNSIAPSFIEATSDQVYVRFHRKNRESWFNSNITADEPARISVFGTGAPVARPGVRQSGARRCQARICDLQQLLSEFWNHETRQLWPRSFVTSSSSAGGERARNSLRAPCKRDGSIRRTYAVPSSREVAGRFELGVRTQIRWLPSARNQEQRWRKADVSEPE